MAELADDIAQAVADGTIGGRVWMYATYRCNLVCTYCLTESGPTVTKRELTPQTMLSLARQAAELGFTDLGVTGGEPLMLPWMIDTAREMSEILPMVLLTNGSYLRGSRLDALTEAFAERPIKVQVSLDSADELANDANRGNNNYTSVATSVPTLVERGVTVRIATTSNDITDDELAELTSLRRSWGVSDEDHIVRPIVARGRAMLDSGAVPAGRNDLPAELCITAEGAFWSAFGPTVRNGRLDTDLLLTRTIDPLRIPAAAMLRIAGDLPRGSDSTLNIR
jgi:MoaA/NifB/PqqE/SkfB family radical SAM enzyme